MAVFERRPEALQLFQVCRNVRVVGLSQYLDLGNIVIWDSVLAQAANDVADILNVRI